MNKEEIWNSTWLIIVMKKIFFKTSGKIYKYYLLRSQPRFKKFYIWIASSHPKSTLHYSSVNELFIMIHPLKWPVDRYITSHILSYNIQMNWWYIKKLLFHTISHHPAAPFIFLGHNKKHNILNFRVAQHCFGS